MAEDQMRGGTMERLDWEHIWAPQGKGGRSHLATPTTNHPKRLRSLRSSRHHGGRSGRHGTLKLRRTGIGCGPRPTCLWTFSDLGYPAVLAWRQPCRWRETEMLTFGGSSGLELIPLALRASKTWFTWRLLL